MPSGLCCKINRVVLQSEDGASSWWSAKDFIPFFRSIQLAALPSVFRVDSKVTIAPNML